MSANKKPRADAELKTLTPERQAAIADYAREHTLPQTRKWLAEDGLLTSDSSISRFLSWYALQQQLTRNESTVEQLLAKLKMVKPDISPAEMDTAGQMFFTALAIEQQDSLAWKRAQDAKAKLGTLELLRQRFLIDSDTYFERLLEKAKELLADTGMTQAARIAAMRSAAFKDVEALQQSGKLVIPK